MRDNLKNTQYWGERIFRTENFQKLDIDDLKNGKIKNERINIVKRALAFSFVQIISAKYSSGESRLIDLVGDLKNATDLTYESWDGFWNIEHNGRQLNQYGLGAYDEMLWMLSLGYLLDVPNEYFKKLVEVIDRDGVKDYLFEFIIRAKIKDRQPITEESYQEFFGVPQTFNKLRQAIKESDKTKAEVLVKEFVTKDWYKNHKEVGWYNSHKSKHNIYFGYWSFETAAVVKIMGLDDSGFRDCQYYPKDLI
ncbi:PoNi-like cognate immunity protein [Dyadobacter sp. 32]|uniref:PoNe immunity protein domain-containing protein n=1 Tax=Dyadobacter sp. 32 TaxID=538966 RepID=UPI0011EBDDFD